jgi:predicted nucleotidyltransferase
MDARLPEIQRILVEEHDCHTVILYGSYARGDAGPNSDYDLAGIRASGDAIRDARFWNGAYLDLFIYPESKTAAPDEAMIHMREGRVLIEKDSIGTNFLKRLQEILRSGPKPLPRDEIQARKLWARKMLERAKDKDIEAKYRKIWLLTALVEDYFRIRGLWYLGAKESFKWLRGNDPETYSCFEVALGNTDDLNAIQRAVERTIG